MGVLCPPAQQQTRQAWRSPSHRAGAEIFFLLSQILGGFVQPGAPRPTNKARPSGSTLYPDPLGASFVASLEAGTKLII